MGLVRVICESRPENVQLLGAGIEGICKWMQSPFEERCLIQTAIVEALNNVVEHAYQGKPDGIVEVEIHVEPGLLKVIVQDQGEGMGVWPDPELEFDPQNISSLPEGSMGIFIINQVMDIIQYKNENGRNVLMMTKKLTES